MSKVIISILMEVTSEAKGAVVRFADRLDDRLLSRKMRSLCIPLWTRPKTRRAQMLILYLRLLRR